MCDTIGKIFSDTYALFGKNSDRSVNEPQSVEYYPAKEYTKEEVLKATYITIPQVHHTNAIVLSRPSWIWGGEIGVNEFGVVIGNEAVFTKGKYGKESLIGMDLLRLGLERGNSAKEAMNVIIELLQKYGQGGNCGFDSDFRYDNSFLIMDRKEIYILDTKDKDYSFRKCEKACISNCLNIGKDGDFYKNGICDFAGRYSDFIMTKGAKGETRRASSSSQKLEGLEDMMRLLSSHTEKDIFTKGSVASVCMHASNSLTADQTTMSMIVELKEDDILIWISGCSLPCISLYKPHRFAVNGLISDQKGDGRYWMEKELYHRRFLQKEVPSTFYLEKDKVQQIIIKEKDTDKALQMENEFYERYDPDRFPYRKSSFFYRTFWKKKNAAL